ncbi:MAG: glyoxalase superfamily protein [Pseudomonadota bacterium]
MTHISLPSRDALKMQARRLRDALAQCGTAISHSKALEHLAHQWGYRDWNTLSAALDDAPAPHWFVGQSVSGAYLGHDFDGHVKSVRATGRDHTQLTLVFDHPIDVVASDRFSAFRRQVNCTVDCAGRTHEKTSDGRPHVVLNVH